MNMERSGAVLISVLVGAMICASCSPAKVTSPAPPTPTTGTSAPHGWQTFTYGRAAISVPHDWSVICPEVKPQDALTLGSSKTSGPCPPRNENSVTLSAILDAAALASSSCGPTRVNSLPVYVGPCSSSNPSGITVWSFPTLGVQAVGAGGPSDDVTELHSGAVVDRVLYTIRRA